MESLTDNVSMSWWYKDQQKSKALEPADIAKCKPLVISRNLEKLIGDTAGGGKNARDFFLAVAAGKMSLPLNPTGKLRK